MADAERPEAYRRAVREGDSGLVGVISVGDAAVRAAATTPRRFAGSAPVTLAGIALCNVDAGFGAIQVGDLLMTSPTPGHAVRSVDQAAGTILAKALEPLASGRGTIRVLVTPR